MSDNSERSNHVLPDAAARRLANQIARAYRGTYGARAGFHTIVTSVTRQMLHAGSSPDTVARAVEHEVLTHPDRPAAGAPARGTEKVDSRMLVELTRKCVADVALELPSR